MEGRRIGRRTAIPVPRPFNRNRLGSSSSLSGGTSTSSPTPHRDNVRNRLIDSNGNPAASTVPRSVPPSRRIDDGDDGIMGLQIHNGQSNAESIATDISRNRLTFSRPTLNGGSSRRFIRAPSTRLLNREESIHSFASHSTAAELDFLYSQSSITSMSSPSRPRRFAQATPQMRAVNTEAFTESRTPTPPDLLRLTTQSSARKMMTTRPENPLADQLCEGASVSSTSTPQARIPGVYVPETQTSPQQACTSTSSSSGHASPGCREYASPVPPPWHPQGGGFVPFRRASM